MTSWRSVSGALSRWWPALRDENIPARVRVDPHAGLFENACCWSHSHGPVSN